MGNWTLYGILIMVGLFFVLVGFLLGQIGVENPLTGEQSTVLNTIIGWIIP